MGSATHTRCSSSVGPNTLPTAHCKRSNTSHVISMQTGGRVAAYHGQGMCGITALSSFPAASCTCSVLH